ncbi:hypothetical protein [Chitinasiproducens palmae]|uniref:Uncharacterized protein n=1 Tax=Chitinasiproducens palmae TaxID=1770053 RepID=A0A1H2PTX8_9BURK|nr:hypothetical protein [Chitinasiproducens palmae]SDV50613.1 hypothetical protein SAMN05216551_112128 [Chitinasiproducens palmae]
MSWKTRLQSGLLRTASSPERNAAEGHAAPREVPHQRADDPTVRACVRLLGMVHELHKAGYQRLRISPGMAPSGVHWRCTITHAGNVMTDGYTPVSSEAGQVVRYSSASGDAYFGWHDAAGRTARELATCFIERFPALARASAGRDWRYAGWLTEMLGRAEQGRPADLPVLFADYPLDCAEILPPPP